MRKAILIVLLLLATVTLLRVSAGPSPRQGEGAPLAAGAAEPNEQ